ncbi:MAG: hypothetical protein P1P87_13315 [Trueperaceae bacterium]|nr:hypothetical protein [Trueperaceae bacterium]
MEATVRSAYGVTFRTTYPFRFHLGPGNGPVDLTFDVVDRGPLAPGWDAAPTTYAARDAATGIATGEVRVVDGWHVLRFMSAADFFVRDDRALAVLHDPAYAFAVDIWFLGTVLTYWLELRGVPVLHAASVEVPDGAIGFVADHGAGKSTLVASFVAAGHRLLGDDVLPLERRDGRTWARPGYPQMRMWPEQARRLLGSEEGLERVQPAVAKLFTRIGDGGFGAFCPEARPLRALYLPRRTDGGRVAIEPVGLGEGVTQLVRHSFLTGLVEASGLTAARFGRLASVVRQVPVRRLTYPSGFDRLAEVRAALLADAAEAGAAAPSDEAPGG